MSSAAHRTVGHPVGAGTRRLLSGLILLALVGLAVVGTAAPALAHASLVEVAPADRAAVASPPTEVMLVFDEPVTLPTGGLRVFDSDANRVDEGALDTDDPLVVGVALPAELPDGGYVVTYRVVSEDSHPLTGVSTFTVGDAAAVDDALVAELFGGGDGLAGVLGPALRALGYAAVLLAAGVVLCSGLLLRREDDRRFAARLSVRAALVGIGATVLAVPVQAAAVTGEGLPDVLGPTVLGEVLASSFGQGTLVRLVWLGALAVFVARRAPWPASALAAAISLGSFLLDGHQRSVEPTWLLVSGDAVHLGAAALWFAGLVLLAVLVRRRGLDDDPVGAARLVARFSTLALVSFGLVAAAGGAMAWALVRTPQALTSTTYGWTLLAKVALVVLVLVIAVYNRQRLVPAIGARVVPSGGAVGADGEVDTAGSPRDREADPDRDPDADPAARAGGDTVVGPGDRAVRRSRVAWRQLRTTLAVEVTLLLGVLAVTGALVTIQPAAQAAGVTGAFQTVGSLTDELDVEITLDPNRAGLNAVHIYVLDQTGRPADAVEDLHLNLTYVPEDIGPFRIEPFSAGPGHWTGNIQDLTFAGEWRIEVVAGIDRFTEARTEIPVVVNP